MFTAENKSFHLTAPGKVNLRLKVTGRRADGYHLLDMVMVKLTVADEMDCQLTPGDIRIVSNSDVLPVDDKNILWKVIDRVRRESGQSFGCDIKLTKRVPIAAGMGGGSSDAASLLLGLNEQLKLGWSFEKLVSIGVKIGSDVPFFLVPGPQRVTGVGELLEPIAVKSTPIILINPAFPVSTPDVYGWFDEFSSSEDLGLTPKKVGGTDLQLENDLEKVVLPRYPVLAEIKQKLDHSGALGSLMSGSGPTVFGVYGSTKDRDQGYEVLQKEIDPKWWLCKCESLS
jgi:4-diphosphocytidyl-2-C-methyl-D-erythritol kinase